MQYMSPERLSGEEYTFSSDVWALGLTLMTCALGRYPLATGGGIFGIVRQLQRHSDGCEPLELPPTFSAPLRAFVRSCLAFDPERRGLAAELASSDFSLLYDPSAAEEAFGALVGRAAAE